jgi:hypothetical protein
METDMTREQSISTADLVERTEATPTASADGQRSNERLTDDGVEAREQQTPLMGEERGRSLLEQWTAIQAGFVDSPRDAVEQADSLVAEVMQDLARSFAEERGNLEQQWDSGADVETEDLRVALQRYRSFFQRLLAA